MILYTCSCGQKAMNIPHPHCCIVAERTTFETAHIATTFWCYKNVLLHSAGRILNAADLLRYNNCYPESASEFIYIIISCTFPYHLQRYRYEFLQKGKTVVNSPATLAYSRTTFFGYFAHAQWKSGGRMKRVQSMQENKVSREQSLAERVRRAEWI